MLSKHNIEVNALDLHDLVKILDSVANRISYLEDADLIVNLVDSSNCLSDLFADVLQLPSLASNIFDYERQDYNGFNNETILPEIHCLSIDEFGSSPTYFVNMNILKSSIQKQDHETVQLVAQMVNRLII